MPSRFGEARVAKKRGHKKRILNFFVLTGVYVVFFMYFCTMKHLFYIALFCLLLPGCGERKPDASSAEARPSPVSIATAISRQSRLYTSEYVVHKIVTHSDLKRLHGSLLGFEFNQTLPVGDRKILIPLDVTLQAYVDFAQIGEGDIETAEGENGPVLHVTLPDPRIVVVSSKVDNMGVRTHVGLLRSSFKDAELTDFVRQGVASVVQAAPQMGIIESARQNAASVLVPLLAGMGYAEENIVITFRKDFGERDLWNLYDEERSSVKLRQ